MSLRSFLVQSLVMVMVTCPVFGQDGSPFCVTAMTGYQRFGLRWSIAGNSAGQDPNVYSELKWKGVGSVSSSLDVVWRAPRRWVVFASGTRVSTVSGRVSDTDYGADNRMDPVYGQHFNGGHGNAYGVGGGIGYTL